MTESRPNPQAALPTSNESSAHAEGRSASQSPAVGLQQALAEVTKGAKGGIAAFFGAWPGDETDEELLALLKELRG